MSSSFGKKKPAARESAQVLSWLPKAKTPESQAARETQQAFYRITHTEPSRLERARMVRERYRMSA
jgi:hypothetical protein